MYFSLLLIKSAILLLLTCSLCAAQTQDEAQAAKQETVANQQAPLKERHIPLPPGPGTSVQGKVTLRIVVDAEGNVSEARALSGSQELVPSALAWVRKWQYEPPASAPVTKIVEISYGSRDCPGAISERGEMTWSWYLRDKDGKIHLVETINGKMAPHAGPILKKWVYPKTCWVERLAETYDESAKNRNP